MSVFPNTLLATTLCVCGAFAQGATAAGERTFSFSRNETAQTMQQIVNTLRAISNMEQVRIDTTQKTVTMRGGAAQADLAEWIFQLLETGVPIPGRHEYTIPGGGDDVARVFYATHAGNPQQLQEIANAIRSIAEVSRLAVVNADQALVVRGRGWEVGLGEWLLAKLDTAAEGQPAASYTASGVEPIFKAKGLEDPTAVRVYYLPPGSSPQNLQEAVAGLRTHLQIMRVVACIGPRAIALRGTESQAQASDGMMAAVRR
jgi:hypothetical protein